MAFTVAQLWRNNDAVEYSVIADADGDGASGNIAHGMGARPKVTLIPMLQAPAALSNWAATTVDATNIVVSKEAGAVGSGNGAAQLRVRAERRR